MSISEAKSPVAATITPSPELEAMYRAGVHVAYQRARRHPKMRKYIAGMKNAVEVFHLERVQDQLALAVAAMEALGERGGTVLWVGTKPLAANVIIGAATATAQPHVARRWLGGTLTNFSAIKSRVQRWKTIVGERERGELAKYTKQERLRLDEEVEKLSRSFLGLETLERMPDAMFVIDPAQELTAVNEGKKKKVPIFALMNSDCNPTGITYVIPANDNSNKSVTHIVTLMQEAYLRGAKQRQINADAAAVAAASAPAPEAAL